MAKWMLVLVFLAATSAARGAEGPDALQALGLPGNWAVKCEVPPRQLNPHMRYELAASGGTRILDMQTDILDGTFDMTNVSSVDATRLTYTDTKRGQNRSSFTVTIEVMDGQLRTVRSVQNNGTVIIDNGRFISNGAPTLVFQKCS